MAFTYTQDERPTALGNLAMVFGTFTSTDGDTGGDVEIAGLRTILGAGLFSDQAAAGPGDNGQVIVGTTMTVLTAPDAAGKWFAFGVRA
tara:strand:- start:2432 stop:2698 length:267 start_codon:yes stop_codon:yes gene_type:complete